MYQIADITKAVIAIAETDGVDQAFMMLQSMAVERQNTNLLSSVATELDRLSKKSADTNQIKLSAHDSTSNSQQSDALNTFGVSTSVSDLNAAPKIGGLVIQSGKQRLDISIDRQLQKLSGHLER